MSLADGTQLLRHHLRPHHRALWHLAAWSALEAAPAFVAGLVVANAIDRGFLVGRPLVGFGLLAVLAVLYGIGAFGTRQVYPWLAAAVEPLRDSLVTAVITASLRRAMGGEAEAGGSGVVQATVQVETVRALLSTVLRNMRQLLVASIAALGGLTVLSPLLALVVGSLVLLALLLFAGLLRILVVRYRAVVLLGERVGASAAPVTEGMRDVVALGAQARAAREVDEVIDAEAEAVRAFARAWVLRLPVLALGAHLPLLALLALSPWLLAGGHLTVGQIAGGAVYLFSGLQPAIVVLVSTGGTVLVNLGVVLGRLAEVCTEPPTPVATPAGPRPQHHDLEVRGATFAYSEHAEPVVRDLTLEIPEGLHLAVVGPSGVGKSTLANLLARLATPQRGELRLGGSDLEEVDERDLRRTVALIPQEAYVFSGTVRDNLVYLQPQATEAELDESVAAVGLKETISHLGGYDAEIEPGGGTLSPGERQLVALARVFLSPARVIILDEATCHLDPVAEARAEYAFAARHGTLIVIAHRISSALRADRILIMDGQQTALGTHEELLDRSSLYAELVGHWWGGARAATPPAADGSRAGVVLRGLDLVAHGVGFRYHPNAEPVLRDVHLTVPHGEHLAVVGPNGAGKSTLAAALAGLITPQQGTVTLDGVPVARAHAGPRRTLVALVPQHPYVLTGTLRKNLTYLAPEADDHRLAAAAEALGATELLAGGLDAPAAALSVGHRQLVALLRVYVSEAQVVMLDEATCHLDPTSEEQVELAFRRRGSTLIVVAHRLSSATRADRVLLLDGDRSTLGRHDQLMGTCHGYARMCAEWDFAPEIRDHMPALVGAGDKTLARLRPWRPPAPAGH